jgi:hypothetical protein
MKISRSFAAMLGAGILAATPGLVSAQSWTSWTSGSAGAFGGTLLGSSVTFTGGNVGGELFDGTVIGPLTDPNGLNFFNPSDPYTKFNGVTVSPALTVPGLGMIEFNPASTNDVLTFTGGAAIDPYFALISIGQPTDPTTWTFSSPFTVLSNNNCNTPSYWACGSYTTANPSAGVYTITGSEFSGTLEFTGTFSSMTFSTTTEDWNGFTVGAAAVTPEPATMSLLATGLVGLAGVSRRRKRSA